MIRLAFTFLLLFSVFTNASELQARFELDSKIYTAGVRLAEFRTDVLDVTYKALHADDVKIVFNVYITNIGGKPIKIDASAFSITSLGTKEIVNADNPRNLASAAEKNDYFPKVTLNHNGSAGGRISFSVRNAEGRWALKNKLTGHFVNFAVK